MTTLVEKIRARRETWVKAGKFEFKLRRPTRLEIQRLPADVQAAEFLIRFFVDWRNMTENDVIGGGGTSPVPYDAEAWAEWISDRHDLWPDLLFAVTQSLEAYAHEQSELEKN